MHARFPWMCRLIGSLALSVLFALPLASLFQGEPVTTGVKAVIVVFWLLAVVRPAGAVLAAVALLPLALPLEYFLGPTPDSTGITEAIVLAFASGAALRFAAPSENAEDRLGRPALLLGALIAASLAVSLFGLQAGSPTRHIAADLWRHVTTQYLFAIGGWSDLHQGVRWLGVLAMAVFVERALRRSPATAPMAVRMMLVGGAAAASFAALRVGGLLLEGRIHTDRLEILRFILREHRITALHPDPNAAGSYFALLLVPALVIAVRHRSIWLAFGVVPFLALAFTLAKSRAAMLTTGVVIGLIAIIAMVRARRFVLAASVVVVIAAMGVLASTATRASHASLGRAASIRQDLTTVGLEMTADHPAFGVGVGRFQSVSRFYFTDAYPELQRWAPRGQNAHNNFLQILGELGIPGLLAFLWLVVPSARRWTWQPAGASETVVYARAMAAGLATFLLSAIFGHPLLIVQVAAAFFAALGVTAALVPAPTGSRVVGAIVLWSALVVVAATLPWRMAEARAAARDEVGLSRVAGTLDDVPYRVAEPVATWRIGSDVDVVVVPLRWQAPGAADCHVDVVFAGQAANQIKPDANAWMPMRFRLPPASARTDVRALQLRVSDARCTLLVGPMRKLR